jgi:hypothetical protein
MDLAALRSLLRTFTEAFAEVLILGSGRDAADLILLGSGQPLTIDWNAVRAPASHLKPGGVIGPVLLGTREARDASNGAPVVTDSNGLAEFHALTNLYRPQAHQNAEWLFAHAADPWAYVRNAPAPAERRGPLVEMARFAILSADSTRATKYAAQLRAIGDGFDADLFTGDISFLNDRRQEAVDLWRKCITAQPEDRRAQLRLVEFYRLLRPEQRPPEFDVWAQNVQRTPDAPVMPFTVAPSAEDPFSK